MSSTRHERVSALFAEARRLPPGSRAEFLVGACGADDALRDEVESLLAEETALDPSAYVREIGALAADVAGRPMEPTAPGMEAADECVGTTVGRYRLLQAIGEGGFGRVYVADQTEPVVRRVALKIIKLGMDTKQVIARFEAERQALAMMDHPSIAKVLDAGATNTGRPYFVMELVRGVPITEYCDANRLDPTQRIELFMDVCAAVQHAHQKGIIHRDLKPSNVMVEMRDGKPVPKVIDFGIAKAMNQKLTEKTIFTEYQQFVGTPQYTSPEQAEMSGLDIDTRSDVYALGVLLYELMTGATPFGAKRLRSAGFGEIQRIIREEDPAKPSTRLTIVGAVNDDETQSIAEIARRRRMEPDALRRTLRGDLDWIVMKAMEKDRTRRYDTASGLGHDLRRHLEHKPVLAGPPSTGYRFRKFARRNRAALGVVVAAGLALAAGLAVAAVGFYQASQQRDDAVAARLDATAARDESEAVTSFLTEMLAAVDPRNEGEDVTVRAVLDAAGARIPTEFADRPVVAARLRHTIGMTYGELGQFAPAEQHLEAALDLRLRELGEESAITRDTMNELAFIYHYQERFDEAQPLYERARTAALRYDGPQSRQALSIAASLASVYRYREQFDKAERLYEETLPTLRQHYPDADITATAINNYGVMCFQQKRLEEAVPLLVEALDRRRSLFGDEHPSTLSSLANLASAYRQQDRLDEAAALLRTAVAGERKILPEGHWYRGDTLVRYARLLIELADYEDAEVALNEAYPILRDALGADHTRSVAARDAYVKLYELWKKPDKAAEWLAQVPEMPDG